MALVEAGIPYDVAWNMPELTRDALYIHVVEAQGMEFFDFATKRFRKRKMEAAKG